MNSSSTRYLSPAVLVSLLAGLVFSYPFLWMFLSAFKTNKEISQPLLLFPADYEWDAFAALFSGKYLDFTSFFLNSVFISCAQALFATAVTACAGFAFAKLNFRFKGALFLLAVLVILVPKQALAIPLFEWLTWLELNGSRWAVILPGIASGLGIVFFTQIFSRIPNELIDLARVEGASLPRTFLAILPLVAPALVTHGLIHFILAWQEHLFPLLLLSDANQTLPLGLAKLRDSSHRIPEAVAMAAATFTLVPVVTLFAVFYGKMRTALAELTLH
jgi:ABC-type glycerol-3-phosphate transport system permease component